MGRTNKMMEESAIKTSRMPGLKHNLYRASDAIPESPFFQKKGVGDSRVEDSICSCVETKVTKLLARIKKKEAMILGLEDLLKEKTFRIKGLTEALKQLTKKTKGVKDES